MSRSESTHNFIDKRMRDNSRSSKNDRKIN